MEAVVSAALPSSAPATLEGATLDHVGFVTASAEEAARFYRDVLGCEATPRTDRAGQGIAKVYVQLTNLKIELIEPTTADSPIRATLGDHNASDTLARHPGGVIHHVCYAVPDLHAAHERLLASGYRVLGDGGAAFGASVLFIDPASTGGALIELKEQAR